MSHIFISYSREDLDYVNVLVEELRKRNINVWFDAHIQPSETWFDKIVEAIEACSAYIIVMSERSLKSKWVKREIMNADRLDKPAFPILLSGDVFPLYVATHYVSALENADLPEYFYEALEAIVPPQTQSIVKHSKNLPSYKDFWQGLIEKSTQRGGLVKNRATTKDSWLSIGAGKSGLTVNYWIFAEFAGLDLYIDTGDYDKNKKYFDLLYQDKDAIEVEFGETLQWQRLEDRRASRIRINYYGHGSLREPERWDELQEFLLDEMVRFNNTLRKRIKAL